MLQSGHCTQMTTSVNRSQFNGAPLRCGGTGESLRRCAADKYAATVWSCHFNMFEYLQHVVESTPQRIKAVLKLKGVQFSAGKVYLMKWLVSIYAFIAAQAYNHSAAAKQTCPAPVSITPLNILSLSHTLFCTHTHNHRVSGTHRSGTHACIHSNTQWPWKQ